MAEMNLYEISLKQFADEIEADLDCGNYSPMVGFGKAGVGKTVSIHELANKRFGKGKGYKEIRLITMTPVDMVGVPDIVEVTNRDGTKQRVTEWVSNGMLPTVERDGEEGILVIDEITSAQPDVRAAAFQLLDSSRSLGSYKLPEKWKVIALGNGEDDGGVFNGMEAAFLNRLSAFRIEADFDSWKNWAIEHEIHPVVLAYLQMNQDKLHQMPVDGAAEVFPSPRSWEALSTRISQRETRSGAAQPLKYENVMVLAGGAIGGSLAPQFAAFYEHKSKLLNIDNILEGKGTKEEIMNCTTEALYISEQSIVSRVSTLANKYTTAMKAGKGGGNGTESGAELRKKLEKTLANVVNWCVLAAGVRLDLGIALLGDIARTSPAVVDIILDDEFNNMCPALDKFIAENNVVFS